MYIEEGMDTGANPMFLMEINEALDEEQSKEELDKIGASMKDKLKDLTEQIDASLHKGMLPSDTKVLCFSPFYSLFSLLVFIQMLSDVLVSHMVELSFAFAPYTVFFLFNRRVSSCQSTFRPNEILCEH
ncbi:hypothetical protein J4Q44_G00168370 [Coregonus suidteri]|uniref:Co-chaperone HscB C-terminal oligomerisation domain-containing protein n=1 Tax=Coregonus suidteri TaxID=861788 RepID=A0AAN8QRJ2_9TELE